MHLFALILLASGFAFSQIKPAPANAPKPAPAQPPKASPPSAPEFEKKEFPADEYSEVNIISGGGDLKVLASTKPAIAINVSKPKPGTRCELQIFKTPELALMIRAAGRSSEFCPMDGEITTPSTNAFKGTFESGKVRISDIKAISEVTMGSGDITLEGVETLGSLKIRRGSATLDRMTSGTNIVVQDNANVRCNFSSVPNFGKLEVDSKNGITEISLPKGSQTTSANGAATDFEIKFKLEQGEITFKRN